MFLTSLKMDLSDSLQMKPDLEYLICKDILTKWGLDIIYIAHMPDIKV